MIRDLRVLAGALLACTAFAPGVAAQPLGTFRWQLQPFCNVVTVAVTQNGAVFRLEGTDDQCGNGADAASVTGTAFLNADGTIGFGLNIVTAPGGRPLHVDAEITAGAFNGTWRDSAGASGTFAFTPGAGGGGSPRPLPSSVPSTIVLRPDGGFTAGGAAGVGAIPASGPGTRMMWYPGKAAFRAGEATGVEWDDAKVGRGSVALGTSTVASGEASTAIGIGSLAKGIASLAGGILTEANGNTSFAFGNGAKANGINSVALGARALAAGNGSFVFADSSNLVTVPASANQFAARAAGGVVFSANASNTLGVALLPGGTDWTSVSDVRAKHRFRDLDGDDVLARIAQMPVTEWSYKAQDAAIRHIGPTAQDFHAAFGLGQDPLRIGTLDADGVALAGVRALEARSRQHRTEHVDDIATLRAGITALEAEVARLHDLLAELLARPR